MLRRDGGGVVGAFRLWTSRLRPKMARSSRAFAALEPSGAVCGGEPRQNIAGKRVRRTCPGLAGQAAGQRSQAANSKQPRRR